MGTRSGLMSMSRRDVDSLYDSMRDAHSYIQSRRDGASGEKGVTNQIVQALEVGAGAAGVGVLAGRLQTTSIGDSGVPLGLALGFAGHLASFFDIFGQYSGHVQNLSNGAIAGWMAMWGAGEGKKLREKAGLATGPIIAGALPPAQSAYPYSPASVQGPPIQLQAPSVPQRGPLTEAELAALMARRR